VPKAIEVAPDVTPLLDGGGDQWKLRIIGDRFQAGQDDLFLRYCREFADNLSQQGPFAHDHLRARIQIDACFTPTSAEGMFKCEKESERRIYGQSNLVEKYLRLHDLERRRNDLVLVLMNFDERGGAGERGNDNIAWTTPVDVLSPTREIIEHWYDVGLHELGHAFDLDDEYEQPWPDAPDTPPKANVCAHPDEAPWKGQLNDQDAVILHSHERVLDASHSSRDHPTPHELERFGNVRIGLFQGARYSSDRFWRSSLRCKMRSAPQPFCDVCQAVISGKILSNG
jgi:hypothetical protein